MSQEARPWSRYIVHTKTLTHLPISFVHHRLLFGVERVHLLYELRTYVYIVLRTMCTVHRHTDLQTAINSSSVQNTIWKSISYGFACQQLNHRWLAVSCPPFFAKVINQKKKKTKRYFQWGMYVCIWENENPN